jgi:hypothetical protein
MDLEDDDQGEFETAKTKRCNKFKVSFILFILLSITNLLDATLRTPPKKS